jgi:aromatic ring-cleaving dioxygenase
MTTTPIEISNFHAHVYFDPDSREVAARLREGLKAEFDIQLGRWHEAAVGPHLKPMYQVLFTPQQFGEVVPWLMLNREGLDILVHPSTGNDLLDHTNHALWLGTKLALKLEVL